MTTLDQTLRQLVNEHHLDPEAATDQALDGMTKAQLIAFVRPIVLMRARQEQRRHTRRLEREAFRPRVASVGSETVQTRPQAMQELNRRTFPLPSGGSVAWGEATVNDHLARAGWQRSLAASIVADAEVHEYAARLIEEAGVSCLDEIPNWDSLLDEVAA